LSDVNGERHGLAYSGRMQTNLGTVDRTIRVLVGLALLSFILTGETAARWLGLLGFVPLATAVVGSCPVYALFGATTCPIRQKGKRT
jgi:hypothetical protein